MPASFTIPLKPFSDIYDSNHKWGGEFQFINESEYCAKFLYLGNSLPSSLHYHKIKKETFLVLKGSVTIHIPGQGHEILNPGEKLTINPGIKHQFAALNNEPALILEASTHHDDSDTYR